MEQEKGEPKNNVADVAARMVEAQLSMIKTASSSQAEAFRTFLTSLQAFTHFGAVFKTSVQKGGRISIPEAEREALGIEEGSLIQVVIIPLKRS